MKIETIHHIEQFLHQNRRFVKAFFVVFYLVGFVGIQLPYSQKLFLQLIPFALLLSFATALFFQATETNAKTAIALTLIFISSFLIELAGVNTGMIFGTYHYGHGLGFKLYETPIIIGINWAFLVYFTYSISNYFQIHPIYKAATGAFIMLVYDIALEQSAANMDMWVWQNNIIPLQNYIAWFFIALIFHLILRYLQIQIRNKMCLFLFLCQFLFFVMLYLFKNIGL